MFKTIISKIRIILFSRFKKEKNQDWIEERRSTCKTCIHNSKNKKKKPKLIVRFMIALSDFYSFLTGNRKIDNLGNCTACAGCSIFYKTEEAYESCPEDKWTYKLD